MFGSRLEVRRFEKAVLKYEAEPVATGRILLYGHSLFTRCSIPTVNHWGNANAEDVILNRDGTPAVLNHGFGTSSADDLLYYYDRLVRPYQPRALMIATSNNDFGFGYSAADVVDITARIIDYAQADFPGIPVYFCTNFPGLKHKGTVSYFTRLRLEFDRLVEDYCAAKENVKCVRLIDMPFLFEDPSQIGNYDALREDIYADDRAHFNPYGYDLFLDYLKGVFADLL